VKATDAFGEDGDFLGKKAFIERLDEAAGIFLKQSGLLLVITGDHSTPCALKRHSGDPVPLMMVGEGVRTDQVTTFGERSCAQGGLGRLTGLNIMPEIINLLGLSPLIGN